MGWRKNMAQKSNTIKPQRRFHLGLKKNSSVGKDEKRAGLLLILPAAICWVLWFATPFIQAFNLSFYDYSYINPSAKKFIGLGNYIQMFHDPKFILALKNTLAFVVITVPIMAVLALLLAMLLNANFKGRALFRTIYFIPYTIAGVAVATVFMYLFVKGGAVQQLLTAVGFKDVTWYADTKLAMPFFGIMFVWQLVGFFMIYYLSGMQTISASVYEAAKIDGASNWQIFRYITLPLLKPITYLVVIYSIIQAFQVFDQIAAVTSANGGLGSPAGSTNTLLTYFYQNSFRYYKVGYGSAIAVVLFLIILVVSLIQNKLSSSENAA